MRSKLLKKMIGYYAIKCYPNLSYDNLTMKSINLLSICVNPICFDCIYVVPYLIVYITCSHVNPGATNKPQELDDAVLRRLVSVMLHELAAT